MRIVRFEKDGVEKIGDWNQDAGTVRVLPWASLAELYAESDPIATVASARADGEDIVPDRLLAPVPLGGKVIGTGGNYSDHAAEASSRINAKEAVFLPFLPSAVIGPDAAIRIPSEDTFTDYEVEFCVVIGRTAKNLTEEDAMDYVLGYTILNDVSARDVMEREMLQVMLSKSPDSFLPVGPAIVTADEIADPYALRIYSTLNGIVRQDSVTGAMTTRIPRLLAMITRYVTLEPGDVISTGTPGGVGFFRDPQEQMKPGDVIVAAVESVGELSNPVVAGY